MRPNSRGFGAPPGTSAGNIPPGTGFRPGSGRKPPGSARLRTGIAPSGAGTQAAQGVALNASINVQDRPVTGQGMMGMRAQTGQGRLIEDTSYYVGILRKRIADVTSESRRLNGLIESNSKDSSQYASLEKRYETLLKNKEVLEGQLADYNLAMDKTRTSTDPEDVNDTAMHLAEKNRQVGQELDRILINKKQKETEVMRIEEQLEAVYREIQARINALEPGKLRAYNELLNRQRDLQEKTIQAENRLNELTNKISRYESDERGNAHRKEFGVLMKQLQSLNREIESLNEEVHISSLDPKEAHGKFVARVQDFKNKTKDCEDRVVVTREDISRYRKQIDDLENVKYEEDNSETAKYEMMVKRDREMTDQMEKYDGQRAEILAEKKASQDMIVALLEHISRELEDSTAIPSQEAALELQRDKNFKEKNLLTAQRTMESLMVEKRKREKEIEALRISEPKFTAELASLKENVARMRSEMVAFQDVQGLKKSFDATQLKLQNMKHSYIKRRDAMRVQVQGLSMEHESLKKILTSHEIATEIEDTEKRLKQMERTIFELREFVETKSRETDYELVKGNCLRMLDTLNTLATKKCQSSHPVSRGAAIGSAGSMTGAQAKW
jgi:intraflagellar transport protein 74